MDTHLEFVKAESVNAVDVALGNDGLPVGFLDDAEDVHTLMLAAHDQEYLNGILGVPTGAFKDGASTVSL